MIELDREHLLALVQTDTDIGELIMRAFIIRRVELIAHGLGDVVVLGSNYCSGTLVSDVPQWISYVKKFYVILSTQQIGLLDSYESVFEVLPP